MITCLQTVAISRKKGMVTEMSIESLATSEDGETSRKRSCSVQQGSGSGIGPRKPSAGAKVGEGVPFLNLRKVAVDPKYLTLHGDELFSPTDTTPEEKLHRVWIPITCRAISAED